MSISAISDNNEWLSLLQQLNTSSASNAASSVENTDDAAAAQKINFADMIKARLDTDGDGKISDDEIAAAAEKSRELLGTLNTSQARMCSYNAQAANSEAVQAAFAKLDADGDGVISAEEFGNASPVAQSADTDELEERFNQLDVDGDGSISAEEFAAAPPPPPPPASTTTAAATTATASTEKESEPSFLGTMLNPSQMLSQMSGPLNNFMFFASRGQIENFAPQQL